MSHDDTEFFENLIPVDEFLARLKHQYKKRTIYKWISEGMPHKKVKGKLWLKNESFTWLLRTNHG